VRGLAATPDGAHAYTLDGSGVLRGFAFGRNDVAPRAYGTTTWPGQDVARGVAIGPEGSSGLVVDRYGGLHPFGIGTNRTAPKVLGAPTWPGVDMARGVAMMPDGSGGFELDAFGGLHWFSLGTASPAPRLFGVPSFPHDDAARGLALFPDGSGGFEVDKAGNFAWFSIGTRRTQPPMTGSATWPGTDTARGLILLTSLLAWPAPVAKTLVPVSGTITDVVVDAAGAFAYATTQGPDRLAVVDLASRTLVASITVGSSPSGLDLTPDGTKLYVTNKGGGISVVSVGTRQVQRTIAVPHGTEFPELAVFPASIAIAANGTALVSTISSPGSGGPLYQLDLATDTFTDRSDHTRAMTDEMILKPSGDRTRLVFAIGGTSGGTVGVYSTSTDTFFFRGWDRFIDYATLNHDGSRVLVDGRSVCDTSSTRACDLVGGSHIKTGVLAATGPLGYRPEGTTLQTFDSDALRVLANHELGDTVTGFWSARTAVSPDSRTAVVVTDHGLAVIDLTI
jgi:YVTN family beta-propeller protein